MAAGAVIVFLGLLALISQLEEKHSEDCSVKFSQPEPLILEQLGSKISLAKAPPKVTVRNTENIDIYCAAGFTNGLYANNGYRNHKLNLYCESGSLKLNEETIINGPILCSSDQTSEMFESRTSLPDCQDHLTVVVGQNLEDYGSLKSLAMCYDALGQKLKYISYSAYPDVHFSSEYAHIKIIDKAQVGHLGELQMDNEISDPSQAFITTSNSEASSAIRAHFTDHFGEDTFQYDSLIQEDIFAKDLTTFKDVISIVWLRALRTGSWRHMLNALQIASQKTTYAVRIGVSGALHYPTTNEYNDSRTISINLDTGNALTVPANIWAHIRALEPVGNSSDEFVVVANNSPFIRKMDGDGFCRSMCNEIPWLRDSVFGMLQQYPVYGLVQCCRFSDVVGKLDNLPNATDSRQTFEDASTTTKLPTLESESTTQA